jgi:uncharacterized protein YdeI (YjbR/CyaY-like superfamily)
MTLTQKPQNEIPVKLFKSQTAWTTWLDKNHAKSSGVWLQIAKKTGNVKTVTYAEAVEVALCYGWIDGQGKGLDESAYLQRFTPRGPRSIWSKINQKKALELIKSGRMQPAGLAAIDRAKQNGRWAAAYDSHRTAAVPADLQAALDQNSKAAFLPLDSTNRLLFSFVCRLPRSRNTCAAS